MTNDSLDKLINKKSEKHFICIEVNPPRGTDLEVIFKRFDKNLAGVDFFNITDSALARMRCAPIPIASILKQRYGIEPLVNFTCRDRNLLALQADLLGGAVLGIRSLIALTGDALTLGDHQSAKAVFEFNSVKLIETIAKLNEGKDLAGNDLSGPTQLIPGCVVNPNARNFEAEIKRLQKKKDAGARYALSQPVFDIDSSKEFFIQVKERVGMPVLMGLLPFKSAESAQSISSIPGIKIDNSELDIIRSLPAENVEKFSIDLCLRLAEVNAPYVDGFHIISGKTPKLAMTLVNSLTSMVSARKLTQDTETVILSKSELVT